MLIFDPLPPHFPPGGVQLQQIQAPQARWRIWGHQWFGESQFVVAELLWVENGGYDQKSAS